MRTTPPPPEDMRLAADWLRQYEDDQEGGVDAARCSAVANWLEDQAASKELREVARETGISVSRLRAIVR